MVFRFLVGAMLALISCVTLLANSYLLGSGAVRWASETNLYQQLALAAGGAVVPWLLAVFPLVFKPMMQDSGFFGRLGLRLLLSGMWVVFFGYNFVMGSSNLAKLREDKVAEHVHEADTATAKKERRAELKKQLDGIPTHRPAEAVSKLLDAAKTSKKWDATTACTDATSKASREFCDQFHQLEAEQQNALEADKLTPQIALLDAQLEASTVTTADNADPWVDAVSEKSGASPHLIRVMLAMATPVVLEIMGASTLKFAVALFGVSFDGRPRKKRYSSAEEDDEEERKRRAAKPYAIPSPQAMRKAPAVSLAALTRAQQIARWFFQECAKPLAEGCLPEVEWFDHYCSICKRSNDAPIPVEQFRRMAASLVGLTIEDIEGEKYFRGYLPLIKDGPARIAAA